MTSTTTAKNAIPKTSSKKKYSVGDKVFVVEESRYSKKITFNEGTVTRVGRKYFTFTVTITGHGKPWLKSIEASIDSCKVSQRNEGSVCVYSSREEYELETELHKACEKIQSYVRSNWNLAHKLTLEKARQIVSILGLESDSTSE